MAAMRATKRSVTHGVPNHLARHLAGLSVALLVGSWCARGAAADPAAHDKALKAFQAGRTLIDQGDCRGAIPKLEESIALEPTIGAHLSIAVCCERDQPL